MQSTISPTNSPYPIFPEQEPTAGYRRSALDFAGIFLLLLVVGFIVSTITWQFWHVNRIYGGVTIANVAVGGLTRAQALQTLAPQVNELPQPALSLTYGEQQWPVATSALQARPDLLAAVNQAYLIGRQDGTLKKLGQQLVAILGGIHIQPPLAYDQGQVQRAVIAVADEAAQPGRPARQFGDMVIPAEPEVVVDIGATTQALWAVLHTETPPTLVQLPLVVTEMIPTTTVGESVAGESAVDTAVETAVGDSTAEAASALGFSQPLRLADDQYNLAFAIDPVLLRALTNDGAALQLDEAAMRDYLTGLATQIDIAPRNARLRFNPTTGGVTVIQESHVGRRLDIDSTIASLRETLAADGTEARLVMTEVPPAVDMNRIAEMGIRELVASGTSYFQGSSVERVHNIVVAAEKFDGLVIPPGEIFSFNQGVEDVTSANGFEDSLIIMGDTTAVGVGGGVCQVSTTVFRAAYNGGFDIVERYNHGYVVSWYGAPGLDATIYTPTVDFRFRNNTNAFLLVEPAVNTASGVITFNFYGTKPDREVNVGVPQRSDVIEPEEPIYVVNEELAAGQIVQKEWEQKGMTVSVERTITENGTTRTDTITSVYQPWQAVYEMGPGTQIDLTPTPTPKPDDGLLNPNLALTPTPSSPDSGP